MILQQAILKEESPLEQLSKTSLKTGYALSAGSAKRTSPLQNKAYFRYSSMNALRAS